MALKKKAPKPKILFTLHEDERLEYVRRQNLMQTKLLEFQAAGAYIDAFQKFLIEAHDLPDKFDLDLANGTIKERMEENAENGSV